MLIKLWISSHVLLAVGMFCGFMSRKLFDRLLRIQFAESRSEWERQGGPIGYSWFPREAEVSSGTHARDILVQEWRKSAPDWIATNQSASEVYHSWRRFTLTGAWFVYGFFGAYGVCVLLALLR
jgi:hypothetical protein